MAIDRRVTVKVSERDDLLLRVISDRGFAGIFEGNSFKVEKGGPDTKIFLEPIRIATGAVMDRIGVRRGFDIEVRSTIPVAAGLGSSSATSVATVAAVGRILGAELSQSDITDLALTAERFVHVNPSGVDPTVSTYGGLILYRLGEGIKRIRIALNLTLIIGNTGLERNTGNLVKLVRGRKDRLPDIVVPLIELGGSLTRKATDALQRGDVHSFGELMDVNHGFLVSVGVSNEALDRLVHAARRAGALGAKLTGAGGGGCMVALCVKESQAQVAKAIEIAGGNPIEAETTDIGVQVWTES